MARIIYNPATERTAGPVQFFSVKTQMKGHQEESAVATAGGRTR